MLSVGFGGELVVSGKVFTEEAYGERGRGGRGGGGGGGNVGKSHGMDPCFFRLCFVYFFAQRLELKGRWSELRCLPCGLPAL